MCTVNVRIECSLDVPWSNLTDVSKLACTEVIMVLSSATSLVRLSSGASALREHSGRVNKHTTGKTRRHGG